MLLKEFTKRGVAEGHIRCLHYDAGLLINQTRKTNSHRINFVFLCNLLCQTDQICTQLLCGNGAIYRDADFSRISPESFTFAATKFVPPTSMPISIEAHPLFILFAYVYKFDETREGSSAYRCALINTGVLQHLSKDLAHFHFKNACGGFGGEHLLFH